MYNLMTEGLYVDQARATAVVLLVLVIGINALSALAAKRLTRGRAKHEDQGGMNMEQTVNNRPLGRAKMEVKDLNLFYGDFQALKHVSISMPEKEITAFIGPSGCGKSTLLKTLNRMNDLVEGCRIEGQVLLDGEDVYGSVNVNALRRRGGWCSRSPIPFL